MRHALIRAAAAALVFGSTPALALDRPAMARGVDLFAPAAADGWEYLGMKTVALNRDIKHYMWEMTVGDGPYDRIRVHRYVRQPNNDWGVPNRPALDRRKVLFIINGTYGMEGEEPAALFDSIYFPEAGYDLWTMDFRTAFIPNMSYEDLQEKEPAGLQSTAYWTYSVFREDLKQAVDFAKSMSGADQVFMGGRSRGGTQMYIYVAKYAEDVKAMIGLDGGPIYRNEDDPSLQIPQSEYEAMMASFIAGDEGPLLAEVGFYEDGMLQAAVQAVDEAVGAQIPEGIVAPDGSVVEDLTDYIGYLTYVTTAGATVNYYVHQDKETFSIARGNYSRYWPAVQNFEQQFLAGYADNPYLDYDDTQDVDVPVLHVNGMFTCPNGICLSSDQPLMVPTDDYQQIYLPTYGHLDIYYGTSSIQDVKAPMLRWMNDRL